MSRSTPDGIAEFSRAGRIRDMVSWAVLLGAVAYAGTVAVPRLRNAIGPQETYRRVPELVGDPLRAIQASDGDARWLAGPGLTRAHVLYLFTTTCHFCESQKSHIASLLSVLPESTAITASVEPSWRTAGYWRSVSSTLAPPMSIDSTWLRLLGVQGVPTLIFIAPNGTIHDALTGVVLDWTAKTMRDAVARAEGAPRADRTDGR